MRSAPYDYWHNNFRFYGDLTFLTKTAIMKQLIKPLLLSGAIAFFACNGGNTGSTSTDSTAMNADSARADSLRMAAQNATAGEQNFINYAVPGNTQEIIWIQAGIKNGQSKALKDHAKMMLKDHQKLDETVRGYLSSHNSISVPAVDTSNVVNLTQKKGKDWDKAWTDKMVDAHSDLLSKLKQSQTDVKDTALLSIINNTVPVVESHLAMMKTLQGQLK